MFEKIKKFFTNIKEKRELKRTLKDARALITLNCAEISTVAKNIILKADEVFDEVDKENVSMIIDNVANITTAIKEVVDIIGTYANSANAVTKEDINTMTDFMKNMSGEEYRKTVVDKIIDTINRSAENEVD